jgi:hypothetical protein
MSGPLRHSGGVERSVEGNSGNRRIDGYTLADSVRTTTLIDASVAFLMVDYLRWPTAG